MFQGFSEQTVDFMWGIRFNNERAWFEAHKAEYLEHFYNPMKELAREGMTMVVVSHEMSFIREVADKVLVLADGVIIEEGSPQEVFTNPRHERCRSFLSKIL